MNYLNILLSRYITNTITAVTTNMPSIPMPITGSV